MRFVALLVSLITSAFGAGPLQQNLYPAGGGHFAISISACQDNAAVLNGQLVNHTNTNWLYVEIQVKVTRGRQTETYRLNLERIGANGRAIRQKIDGGANQDCESLQLSDLELIGAEAQK